MNKKKRFHILLTGDFPPTLGGQSRYLYNVFYYLPIPDKVVITPFVKGSKVIDNSLSFKIIRIPVFRKSILKILSPLIYFFSFLVLRKKSSLIHCGQVRIAGVVGMLIKLIFGTPYVIYAYGGEFLKFVRFPQSVIMKMVLKNACKIISISRYTTDHIKALGIPEEKIVQTFLGVDTKDFYPSCSNAKISKRYGLKGRKIIMTACRLDDHKGVDMVISALPRIIKEIKNVTYLVVGSGEDKKRLEEIVKEKCVEDKVIFTGSVSDESLLSFYNLCNLYVMPSRQTLKNVEGFGISYVEASACGKPVIGGRSGGVEDAVIDGVTGILVDPEDVDEIANAVIKLLNDKEYAKKLGKNGLERVRKDLRWEKIALHIFNQL